VVSQLLPYTKQVNWFLENQLNVWTYTVGMETYYFTFPSLWEIMCVMHIKSITLCFIMSYITVCFPSCNSYASSEGDVVFTCFQQFLACQDIQCTSSQKPSFHGIEGVRWGGWQVRWRAIFIGRGWHRASAGSNTSQNYTVLVSTLQN